MVMAEDWQRGQGSDMSSFCYGLGVGDLSK